MKSSGTLYWYGLGGEVLAETDNSGNTLNEYIYFAASRIARRDSAGNVYYYYGDHLRSSRSVTTATATLCYDAAGNLTQDGTGVGTHTFQWDGEGRLVSVDGDSLLALRERRDALLYLQRFGRSGCRSAWGARPRTSTIITTPGATWP